MSQVLQSKSQQTHPSGSKRKCSNKDVSGVASERITKKHLSSKRMKKILTSKVTLQLEKLIKIQDKSMRESVKSPSRLPWLTFNRINQYQTTIAPIMVSSTSSPRNSR